MLLNLFGGYVTLIDDEDYIDELVGSLKWENDGYAFMAIGEFPNRSETKINIVIIQRMLGRSLNKGEICDHRNRNKLDNRRKNLRITDYSGNSRNSKISANNKSGFRGVYKGRRGKGWRAQIMIHGECIHLGTYDTPDEASKVFLSRYFEVWGEYPPEIESPDSSIG